MPKTIIVTGGSRGIGRGIVEYLAPKGYQIILNYCKSEDVAKEIQKNLKEKGYTIEIYKADVSNRNQVKKMIQFCIEKFGKIDILINNAGIDQFKVFTDITDEDWENIIGVNLKSAFYVTQEVLHSMLSRQEGCIINMSSIWGIVGASCEVLYSVSKAGMDGMTKALAKELGPSNIRVNSIAPGLIDTDMNKELSEEDINQIKEETPLGQIGKPRDIAKIVEWLIEDEFTTGQIISSNGGWIIT